MHNIGRLKRTGSPCLTNTNGTLLTREVIDELVECGFDELWVTTMAGTAEGYARTHPGTAPQTFERLKSCLRYLRERKTARKRKAPLVNLVTIVIGANIRKMKEFADLALEVCADRVTFRPFKDIRGPGLATLLPSPEDATALKAELKEIGRYLDSRGIPHNVSNFLMTFSRRFDTRAM